MNFLSVNGERELMHSSVCPFCLRGKEGDKGKPKGHIKTLAAQNSLTSWSASLRLHRACHLDLPGLSGMLLSPLLSECATVLLE